MRFLLILICAVFAACGDSAEEAATDTEMRTAADGLQQDIDNNLDKAAHVEELLRDAAEERDAAIEE